MSKKPLELVIHEKVPGQYGREATYNSPDGFWAYPESHVDGYAQDKRPTDAELAAEYWQAHAFHERAVRGQSCIELILEKEVGVVTRFATLPHYDEVTP